MQEPPDPPALPARRVLRRFVSTLIVGLVLCTCVALALIPIFAIRSPHQTQTDHAFQVLFAALFTLMGLLLTLTERQLRRRDRARAPVSFPHLLFTTTFGLTFWAGLALFGIALAQLEAPAAAGPLTIAFWAVAGCWLLAEIVLNARYLLRPRRVRAPGRRADN
ncbi:MAG TPA: hypothetical protein VKT82_08835 [Ktedonobacterales bacterium]|nr:hypothetical protein [Ktedonobacterales bacterium]